MKKTIIFFVILIVAALMAGCMTVSMEYSLDNDNSLEVSYTVVIDKTKEEFEGYSYYNLKKALTEQWELQGMTVEVDESVEQLSIYGSFEKKHDSREEAFESLNEILKSEYSPFTTTGFEYSSSYFEDEYNLAAGISLKDLIRRSNDQVMPTDMQQTLTKYADESDFSLTISLPGEAVDTNADSKDYDDDITTGTWELHFGDEEDIELNTVIVNQENVEYHQNLTDSTNQTMLIVIICAGAALLVLIVFLITFFIVRAKSKNQNSTDPIQ